MTHQLPIPEAAISPYPLHPAPIAATSDRSAAKTAKTPDTETGLSATIIGIGAAIGVSAVAAIGGLVYARRRRAAAKPTTRGGDDTHKRGAADHRRIAASQPYEVTYFARKHGITAAVAREIIREAGPDRKAANALASKRAEASVH